MADNFLTWKARALSKREDVLSLIPTAWKLPKPLPPASEHPRVTGAEIRQYLSPTEIEITEMDASSIIERIAAGEWKCEDVTRAFCHRAALAHQMINCLHEIFFEAAIADAKALDRYYAQHKKPIGPLHGLPISLKDSIRVRGVETSMGYVGWLQDPGSKQSTSYPNDGNESEIVKELRSLGAILYVKTSVPQGSFSGETINHIVGSTPNPYNRNLVVGGSSGGEGGLLALRGSPIGLGTDIGGSIRVPAAWNGCFGLRPSTGRVPYEGIASTLDGQFSIPFVVGPLASSARDLALLMKAILSVRPWERDPFVHEIPWRDALFEHIKRRFHGSGGGMAFGVLYSDEVVNPQPPVRRAIQAVVDILRSLGHSLIEWKPPRHAKAYSLWRDICLVDGGQAFHHALSLSGEPPTQTIFGPHPCAPVDASTFMRRNIALREYRKAYLDYWNSTAAITGTGMPVDAIIMPVAPGPSPPPGKVRYFGYTTIMNVLDYTTSVIPVTVTKKELDTYPPEYTPISETDRLVFNDYDAALLDGSPIGVQIAGRRLQEETVLALSEEIGREVASRIPAAKYRVTGQIVN